MANAPQQNTLGVLQVDRKIYFPQLPRETQFRNLLLKELELWPRAEQFTVQKTDSYERYVHT